MAVTRDDKVSVRSLVTAAGWLSQPFSFSGCTGLVLLLHRADKPSRCVDMQGQCQGLVKLPCQGSATAIPPPPGLSKGVHQLQFSCSHPLTLYADNTVVRCVSLFSLVVAQLACSIS
jgi:hypothetical protein